MASKQKRLEKARKTRSLISRDIQRVRTGVLKADDVLRSPPSVLGRCRIYTVMIAIPGIGDKKIKKILTKAKVWPEDNLAQVPQDRRDMVADLLKEHFNG
jgi:hypothetical protein